MLESMFTEQEMKKIIKENYNLDIVKCQKIDRGSAAITKVSTINKNFIFKEIQDKYDKDFIIKEINIINFLAKKNLKVPIYIQCINGEYYFEHNGRVIIMQEFIDGYTIDNNNGNYEQIIESAKYLGLIVNGLEDFKGLWSWDTSKWFEEEYLSSSINKHKELLSYFDEEKHFNWVKEDIEEKIKMTKKLINNLKKFKNIDKLTYKNSHGDYSVQQFIYKDDKINAIIDFISAAHLPICWEIIRSYSYIDSECKDGNMNIETLEKYVNEFKKYVSLNEYDLKYMPYVYLVQILDSTYGYKQYLKNNSDRLLDFAKQRTNFARWLFNNAERLSEKLLEND